LTSSFLLLETAAPVPSTRTPLRVPTMFMEWYFAATGRIIGSLAASIAHA